DTVVWSTCPSKLATRSNGCRADKGSPLARRDRQATQARSSRHCAQGRARGVSLGFQVARELRPTRSQPKPASPGRCFPIRSPAHDQVALSKNSILLQSTAASGDIKLAYFAVPTMESPETPISSEMEPL